MPQRTRATATDCEDRGGSDEEVALGEMRSAGRWGGNRSPRGDKEWGMKSGEVKP